MGKTQVRYCVDISKILVRHGYIGYWKDMSKMMVRCGYNMCKIMLKV